MKGKKKYFVIFGNVHFVEGYSRNLIVDTYRQKYFLIPRSMTGFIKRHRKQLICNIYKDYSQSEWSILDEYFKFLKENDLVHFSSDINQVKNFIDMPLSFDHFGQIINSIVELHTFEDFEKLRPCISELNECNCSHLQLIFQCKLKIENLKCIANIFDNTEFRSVELYFDYSVDFTELELEELFIRFERISVIFIFSSPVNRAQNFHEGQYSVIYLQQPSTLPILCGQVSQTYFKSNVSLFTESQHHNTCLNRKISIDVNGDIKNCPSMAKSYGNIRDTKLIDVVNNPEFQKVWHIKKDEITKCKDCEFRHICTDCRAYIENPDDQYSAPLKCGYNSYTCEWEEWSTNPLKQQAIDYYGMREIV